MFNPLHWLKVQEAEAHCDIPCGIYDPVSAKIAAQDGPEDGAADSGAGARR